MKQRECSIMTAKCPALPGILFSDTYGGDSGSPVYVTESSNGYTHNTVFAIHTNRMLDQTYHSGVRINSEILRFAYWNPYI